MPHDVRPLAQPVDSVVVAQHRARPAHEAVFEGELLHDKPVEPMMTRQRTRVPLRVYHVMAAVLMVDSRVKAGGVEKYRRGPRAARVCRGDDVIADVLKDAVDLPGDRIGQPKEAALLVIAEVGGPNTRRIGNAAEVDVAKRSAEGPPLGQVVRLVERDRRHPLERRGRKIVFAARPAQAGVGVEPPEHRIGDPRHCARLFSRIASIA